MTKKIMPYLRPYLPLAVISFICAAVSSAATLIIPVLCGKAIDCMIAAGKVNFDGVLKYVYYFAFRGICAKSCFQKFSACRFHILTPMPPATY